MYNLTIQVFGHHNRTKLHFVYDPKFIAKIYHLSLFCLFMQYAKASPVSVCQQDDILIH